MKENNKWKYQGDGRYEKVYERMQFLGIQDVTTDRQHKNGTIVWKLPIKNWNSGKTNIEVASFKTGYVRNQNSGYTNYQLNKRCEGEPEYFETAGFKPGEKLYRKFTTRTCKLIPIEIDRLEYLISYCLKNYYIKNANLIASGDYIPIWMYNHELKSAREQHKNDHSNCETNLEYKNKRIRDLESTVNKQAERLHQIYLKARN